MKILRGKNKDKIEEPIKQKELPTNPSLLEQIQEKLGYKIISIHICTMDAEQVLRPIRFADPLPLYLPSVSDEGESIPTPTTTSEKYNNPLRITVSFYANVGEPYEKNYSE